MISDNELADIAELVREEVVSARGTGVFLSAEDMQLLHEWLIIPVPTETILRAVREASLKTKNSSYFSLREAKRYLSFPSMKEQDSTISANLQQLVDLKALEGLSANQRFSEIMQRIHFFFEQQWRALSENERNLRIEEAKQTLKHMNYTTHEIEVAAQILAKESVRQSYPDLTEENAWILSNGNRYESSSPL